MRFEFTARDKLFFPPGMAANTLRGGLGVVFRKLACVPECSDAKTCAIRASCSYARTFEPSAEGNSGGEGPSGFADWPRPFVFRARHLDGCTVPPGEGFHFDLNVFSLDRAVLGYFTKTFEALAGEGFGPGRGKAELRHVSIADEPVRLDLAASPDPIGRVRVDFLSPTELKHDGRIASRPEFPILFSRVRDRIAMLSRLYGAGALDIDYEGSNARAAEVRMTLCKLRHEDPERRSSRTGQRHAIGGFVGTAEYEGNLAEFVPFLRAARHTGVGRQSVWGKGEIACALPTRPDGGGTLRADE